MSARAEALLAAYPEVADKNAWMTTPWNASSGFEGMARRYEQLGMRRTSGGISRVTWLGEEVGELVRAAAKAMVP